MDAPEESAGITCTMGHLTGTGTCPDCRHMQAERNECGKPDCTVIEPHHHGAEEDICSSCDGRGCPTCQAQSSGCWYPDQPCGAAGPATDPCPGCEHLRVDATPCNGEDNCIECAPEVEVFMPGTLAAVEAERDRYKAEAEAERSAGMNDWRTKYLTLREAISGPVLGLIRREANDDDVYAVEEAMGIREKTDG